ncbi:MAG: hypothetical protein HYX66_05970 [Ignavibacteria bacterium]|nr:hypothetical protein [Ignavibacteria bacterium]
MRTIFTSWKTVAGSPTLVDYREFEPMDGGFVLPDGLLSACANHGALTVVVHSSNLIYHAFPFDAGENIPDRTSFELKEFVSGVNQSEDIVRHVRHAGKAYSTDWMSLLIVPGQLRRNIVNTLGAETEIISDIEADIEAAKLDGDSVLIGRRGEFLWTASIYGLQAPYHLERCPIQEHMPIEMLMEEALTEHEASVEPTWTAIRLFGDSLTPTILQTFADSIVGRGRSVQRFNPFRHTQTDVSKEVQDNIIKRAHILSPLVGAAVHALLVQTSA